ncbi:MAG TPA: hypothetical protein VF919_13350 [Gemmatimonadales bacterium]
MVQSAEGRRFRVRCRACGRTVLSGVARVADAEAAELRAHLARCRPDLPAPIDDDLGRLLARFDVASTSDGS